MYGKHLIFFGHNMLGANRATSTADVMRNSMSPSEAAVQIAQLGDQASCPWRGTPTRRLTAQSIASAWRRFDESHDNAAMTSAPWHFLVLEMISGIHDFFDAMTKSMEFENACHIALASRRTDSHHHPAVAAMALIGEGKMLPNEAITPGLSAPTGPSENAASTQSGVSWAAVIAGGVTASAVAIILLLFGSGLGLASISPWAGRGVSAASFTVFAAIWLIIVQWVASGLGGYMAGRLRAKWVAVHTDEVLFRDTAHGFLSWALGVLVTAIVLAVASGSVVSSGTQLALQATSNTNIANRYDVDLLFRQNANPARSTGGAALGTPAPLPAPGMPLVTDQQIRAEAMDILAEGVANGGVAQADRLYLAQLVAQRTGLPPADAQERVTDVLNREQAMVHRARQAVDASRTAASAGAVYSFVALLIGAFIASVSGAIGGKLRDAY
jgi:hypothetical protein